MARIIIADDDEIVGEIACEALIARGHAAGVIANGRDALHVIRARKPDLVIMDCNMPEMNGLLVLRELRQSAEFCDLPMLVLTARRSDTDMDLAYHQGASDYMKKPLDPAELVVRVEDLLAKRPQPKPARRPVAQHGFGSLARP